MKRLNWLQMIVAALFIFMLLFALPVAAGTGPCMNSDPTEGLSADTTGAAISIAAALSPQSIPVNYICAKQTPQSRVTATAYTADGVLKHRNYSKGVIGFAGYYKQLNLAGAHTSLNLHTASGRHNSDAPYSIAPASRDRPSAA